MRSGSPTRAPHAHRAQVDKWWNTLLPKVKPLLYENGGPIVMVQMENEFGSYGNVQSNPADKKYMEHLVQLARSNLGDKVILYTTDGGSLGYMQRGSLNGSAVYTVGDFGPGSDQDGSFAVCVGEKVGGEEKWGGPAAPAARAPPPPPAAEDA